MSTKKAASEKILRLYTSCASRTNFREQKESGCDHRYPSRPRSRTVRPTDITLHQASIYPPQSSFRSEFAQKRAFASSSGWNVTMYRFRRKAQKYGKV